MLQASQTLYKHFGSCCSIASPIPFQSDLPSADDNVANSFILHSYYISDFRLTAAVIVITQSGDLTGQCCSVDPQTAKRMQIFKGHSPSINFKLLAKSITVQPFQILFLFTKPFNFRDPRQSRYVAFSKDGTLFAWCNGEK